MVFITGKLLSASTSHANKNFISLEKLTQNIIIAKLHCVHNLNFLILLIS